PQSLSVSNGIDSNIARSRNSYGGTVQRGALRFKHLVGEHHDAVADGFRTNQRSAPRNALTRKYASFKSVSNTPILSEHVSHFASSYADMAGGNIVMCSHMTIQVGHIRWTDPHNLPYQATSWVKSRTTFGPTNGHPGQRIFELLFKT